MGYDPKGGEPPTLHHRAFFAAHPRCIAVRASRASRSNGIAASPSLTVG
jgi:hypothetical protein